MPTVFEVRVIPAIVGSGLVPTLRQANPVALGGEALAVVASPAPNDGSQRCGTLVEDDLPQSVRA